MRILRLFRRARAGISGIPRPVRIPKCHVEGMERARPRWYHQAVVMGVPLLQVPHRQVGSSSEVRIALCLKHHALVLSSLFFFPIPARASFRQASTCAKPIGVPRDDGPGPAYVPGAAIIVGHDGKGGTTQVLTEEEYEIFNDQEAEDDAGDNFYARFFDAEAEYSDDYNSGDDSCESGKTSYDGSNNPSSSDDADARC